MVAICTSPNDYSSYLLEKKDSVWVCLIVIWREMEEAPVTITVNYTISTLPYPGSYLDTYPTGFLYGVPLSTSQ